MSSLDAYAIADTMSAAAEMLWVVLANVSGGDWTQQTPEWQDAAVSWRDNYFEAQQARQQWAKEEEDTALSEIEIES